MTKTTAHLTRWGMPNTLDGTLKHLVARHGWSPGMADPSMVQAHRYAHGVDGRPDLADQRLDHTHTAPTKGWSAPATPAPAGYIPETPKRPLKYIILGWNILMAAWIIYGLAATAHQSANCATDLYADACRAGTGVGAAVAIGGILFLTAIVDVILAVIWMVTKKDSNGR